MLHPRGVLVFLCSAVLTFLLPSHAAAQSPSGSILGLRVLDIPGTASGLNDRGDLVGETNYQAFLWTEQTGVVYLGTLPGTTICEATAVNNLRHVVGWCAGGTSRAFLWTPGGGMQDIGPGMAMAINDRDQIAGGGAAYGYWQEAWRWVDGVREPLGMSGTQSIAMGINEAGLISGTGPDTPSLRGFLWHPDGQLEDLGFVGIAFDVNAFEEIPTGAAATWGAQLWRRGEGLIDLGTPEGRYGAATGINNMTYAVGSATDNITEATFAFVWTPDGGYRDIGDAGSLARKINDVAEVAGTVIGTDGMRHPARWQLSAPLEARLRAVAATLRVQLDMGVLRGGAGRALLHAVDDAVRQAADTATREGAAQRVRALAARVRAMLRNGQLPPADVWLTRAIALAR